MTNPRTIARIESRILERIAYCLQVEIHDPRAGFITLTRAQLTPDLSIVRVYWSVMGEGSERSKAEHMLEHATGFIRRQMARVLEMRRVPELRFQYDASLQQASELDKLIREARERDRAINPRLVLEDAAESVADEADPEAGAGAALDDETLDGETLEDGASADDTQDGDDETDAPAR